MCSEREKSMRLNCLQNLAVREGTGVAMAVGVALLIHATSRALESQFRAEEPSRACTTAGRTRKLIALLDHSASFSSQQSTSFSDRKDALRWGVSGSLTCSY